MKYLLLTNKYPSEEILYANAFIHSRVLAYREFGIDIEVFVLNTHEKYYKYEFEKVNIHVGNSKALNELYRDKKYNKCLCHFINRQMMYFIMQNKIETIVWIHGFEALAWYRRIFNFNNPKFLGYIVKNIIQLRNLKKFVNSYDNVTYVFVSEWMKDILQKDINTKISNYRIIPNIINYELFNYVEKDSEKRKNILTIRPFQGKKYANDITVNAILQLSKKEFFSDLSFTICGDGEDFDKLTGPLKKFANVKLEKKFLKQKDIKVYHDKNGIFLCPTRQDSQGVSMCEAMASGLVPITSDNTAIPEFVENNKSGILTKCVDDIVKSIEKLYYNDDYFKELSYNASIEIRKKCDKVKILNDEIDLIKN